MAEQDRKGSAAGEDLATIREQAAAWILTLHDAGPEWRERLQAECEDWQATDPRRRRVLVQMQQMWSAVEPGRKRRRRTGALGLLVVFAVVLAAQLPWNTDYRTAARCCSTPTAPP